MISDYKWYWIHTHYSMIIRISTMCTTYYRIRIYWKTNRLTGQVSLTEHNVDPKDWPHKKTTSILTRWWIQDNVFWVLLDSADQIVQRVTIIVVHIWTFVWRLCTSMWPKFYQPIFWIHCLSKLPNLLLTA